MARKVGYVSCLVVSAVCPAAIAIAYPHDHHEVELVTDVTLTSLSADGSRRKGFLKKGSILCADDPLVATEGSTRLRLDVSGIAGRLVDVGDKRIPIYGKKAE
jgi:hypothetical protein